MKSLFGQPVNEPILNYAPQSAEKKLLKRKIESMARERIKIPLVIGGKELHTTNTRKVVMPHSHGEVLADFSLAGADELLAAIQAAERAKPSWQALPWQERSKIFLRAADLISTEHRDTLNAATMLGQSKNIFQAEVDAACELIDFLRFNVHFYEKILNEQPLSVPGVNNRMEYRPLEGFVTAITPFNFTAIAGNLAATPALLGNTVVWKPSDTQMLSAYYTYQIFKQAGLPDGVINLVGADGPTAGEILLRNPNLGGVHFTGSTLTFQGIFKTIGSGISQYRSYPRIVGETGGKGFIFAHPSANQKALVTALVRGAFEYQGQKCSAASRAYIPKSVWEKIKPQLIDEINTIKMGDVRDFTNFMNAVIDERAFKKISGYQEFLKNDPASEILTGGKAHSEVGYFVEPTLALTSNPKSRTLVEEIFGPILTVFVYEDADIEATLTSCDQASSYALTGAIFADDEKAIAHLSDRLYQSAGNFYINDKCTGAVVGQQPFGGARGSGTNDKAGSSLNLYRWLSARTVKTNLNPPTDYRYSFMEEA